ncbi:amidohydrolase family protein [Roseateles sp. NT4]|uniref:amidohydrolase family protein n=1 Tax=Roseateles sp. NT4 TaxID=3453715 RepID=UPI003EEB47B5
MRLPCLLTLLLCAASALQPARAADYVVLGQNEVAGHLRVETTADGRIETDYSYRDNGRGPDLKESFRLAANGAPRDYRGRGRSTMGAEIAEDFDVADARARWRSRADSGETPAGEDFVFIPLEASPGYYGALVSMLLAQADGSAATLGGLRIRAEVLARLTPDAATGPLALVAVTGADAQPWYYWVRDDATHALFAITWPSWAVMLQGSEALAPTLLARQQQAADERLIQLRQRLARPLGGVTLIRNVRWFDAPAARMRGPSDVWISQGRIDAVTEPGALRVLPERAIDGRGQTLLPGLWDMHAHLWSEDGLAHLAAGVTSVRDPGNDNAELQRLTGRIERGEVIGPHVHAAGFIEGKSPYSSRTGIVAETLDEALDAVSWYACHGFVGIKLYNSIKPEWVRPLTDKAHSLGLHVNGHVPAFMRAEQAVRGGYDELTHINQVMLNFVSRPGDDSRTLLRFQRVGSDAQAVDLSSPAVKHFIALLRERRTVVDPTLAAFEAMFTQAQGELDPTLGPVAGHLPVLWQRQMRVAPMDLDGEKLAAYRRSYAKMMGLTRDMHRAGVPLVAGADTTAGLGLHRELALYVKAGIPAPEVLRIATWNGARVAGASGQRGRIERGYAADLVMVDGDPSADIEQLRRASLVIQGQVAYAPAELYEAMGFKPFVGAPRMLVRPAN